MTTSVSPTPPQASPRGSVYDQITRRITDLLAAGTVPWHKPWSIQTSAPRNFITRKPYRGINVFLLLAMAYESPFWLTFLQASQLGARIRKGEKACPVIFWKQVAVEDKKTEEKKRVRLLRFYHVFNLAQCEGVKGIPPLSDQFATIKRPAEIVEHMPKRPTIKHGMSFAFYCPEADIVGIPQPSRFNKEEEYFSTLFHELTHSTGHPSRLHRESLSAKAGFGSTPYCNEELVAEVGATFLCAHAGISERTVDNSAAYISGWLSRLKSDHQLIIHAAAQAQTAADFVLGTKHDDVPTETPFPATP